MSTCDFRQECVRAEEAHGEMEKSLRIALAKALSGEMPVCTRCRRIRDNDDNWLPFEMYIQTHTDADLSESLCPYCRNALLRGFH